MRALGIAALLSISFAAPVAAQSRIDRLLAQAEAQIAAGRPSRALRHLRRATRADPGDPRAVLRWAELALPSEPVPDHARATPPSPVIPALEAYLATPLRDGDAPARARASAWLDWARALAGDLGGAIDRTLGAAGLQDTEAAASLRRLAALAIVRGDLALSQRALEGARRAMPQDPEVLSDLATVLLARGRPADAIPIYQSVAARRPGDLEALRDLAGARAQAGDLRGAIDVLETVVRRAPDRGDAWLDLARARLEHGDLAGAADAARVALDRADPHDPEPAIVLGQSLAAAGDRAAARTALQEALRRRPGSPRALETLRALDE